MNLGFKELSSVCDAIASGRQSILLRKAGLRESTTESVFQAKSFYLLPTHYHEKKGGQASPSFSIQLRLEIIRSGDLTDWTLIEKLLPLTAYDSATLREHFFSRDEKLLHFALLRAFRLSPSWDLPASPALSGCRSWFELPPSPTHLTESPVPSSPTIEQTQKILS